MRSFRVWRNAARSVFWWFFSVYVGGFIPVAVHLVAVILNERPNETAELARAAVADGYLYAFIVAFAAVVEALVDEHSISAMIFGMLAAVAAAAYFGSLVDLIALHPVIRPWLTTSVRFIAGLACSGYAVYKLHVLYVTRRPPSGTPRT